MIPTDVPPLPQVGLTVTPTRSIYEFEGANVHVTLTFMTPALPQDLDALALPLSYLTWQVRRWMEKITPFPSTTAPVRNSW